MDDLTLIKHLLQHPSFEDVVQVTEKSIITTFTDLDAPVGKCFVDQLKDTRRSWDLKGNTLVFSRPGEITVNHFITVEPEKRSLLSRIGNLRFSIK